MMGTPSSWVVSAPGGYRVDIAPTLPVPTASAPVPDVFVVAGRPSSRKPAADMGVADPDP